MPDRLARVLLCALMTVATILPIVPPAQAAFYSPKFDPEFDGTVTFQIPDACLLLADGTYSSTGNCTLDMITADVFSTADPGTHYTSGFQGNVGIDVVIAGHALTGISTDPPLSCGELCGGELMFFTGGCDGDCFPPSAELTGDTINGTLSDGYTLVRVPPPGVPEPGTLALLLGAIVAFALSRHRKAVR